MKSLKGAALAFVISVIGVFVAPICAMALAGKRKYPWWLTTPDDPWVTGESVTVDGTTRPARHFGEYEETVRNVYRRFGHKWGDVYWLGFRNRLFGLLYEMKPSWLKRVTVYDPLREAMKRRTVARIIQITSLDTSDVSGSAALQIYQWSPEFRERLWEVEINFGIFGVIFGTKLSPIYNSEPHARVRAINMDGRPTFSMRSGKALKP